MDLLSSLLKKNSWIPELGFIMKYESNQRILLIVRRVKIIAKFAREIIPFLIGAKYLYFFYIIPKIILFNYSQLFCFSATLVMFVKMWLIQPLIASECIELASERWRRDVILLSDK